MIRAAEILRQMEQLPLATLEAIAPGTTLILAPHPDDESLGCAGLIALACDAGRPPVLVVVTDGTGSHSGSASYPPARLRALREAELLAAVAVLGLPPTRVHFLRLPDTRTPQVGPDFDRTVQLIAVLARNRAAATICTTWRHDPHHDHAAAYRIGAAVARLMETPLLTYPVWGWLLQADEVLDETDVTGARLDITPHLSRKRRAIAAHASQCTDLIADDPTGFRLPPALLAAFDRPFEVFLRSP